MRQTVQKLLAFSSAKFSAEFVLLSFSDGWPPRVVPNAAGFHHLMANSLLFLTAREWRRSDLIRPSYSTFPADGKPVLGMLNFAFDRLLQIP